MNKSKPFSKYDYIGGTALSIAYEYHKYSILNLINGKIWEIINQVNLLKLQILGNEFDGNDL
jgi:hypothetical protein